MVHILLLDSTRKHQLLVSWIPFVIHGRLTYGVQKVVTVILLKQETIIYLMRISFLFSFLRSATEAEMMITVTYWDM
jgi:hypothetical protein